MAVKKGITDKRTVILSAGQDSVVIKPAWGDGRISLLTGGQYISNTAVVLSPDEAIDLALQLTEMVLNG